MMSAFRVPPAVRLGAGVPLVALVVFLVARAVLPLAKREGPPDGRGGPRPVTVVRTATVVRGTAAHDLETVGVLEAARRVVVNPRATGTVIEHRLEIGDGVRQGEALVMLDERSARLALQQAEADLVVARATVAQARALASVATAAGVRQEKLDARGLAAGQTMEQVEVERQRAQAQVGIEEARVEQAIARLDAARLTLSDMVVRSPASGIIATRAIEAGAAVAPQTELAVVVALDPVRAFLQVPPASVPLLRLGQRVALAIEGFESRRFTGQIVAIYPEADSATRLFRVEVHVRNPDLALRPGMFAVATLRLTERPGALLIPLAAMVEHSDRRGAYVIEGTVARWRPVKTGIRMKETIEVLEGLRSGEEVITLGKHLVSDGGRIERATPTPPVPAPGRDRVGERVVERVRGGRQ